MVKLRCGIRDGSSKVQWYLKPRNSLPDPRGSLSSSMLASQAIAQANREVQPDCSSRYHHGVAVAAHFFFKETGQETERLH